MADINKGTISVEMPVDAWLALTPIIYLGYVTVLGTFNQNAAKSMQGNCNECLARLRHSKEHARKSALMGLALSEVMEKVFEEIDAKKTQGN